MRFINSDKILSASFQRFTPEFLYPPGFFACLISNYFKFIFYFPNLTKADLIAFIVFCAHNLLSAVLLNISRSLGKMVDFKFDVLNSDNLDPPVGNCQFGFDWKGDMRGHSELTFTYMCCCWILKDLEN